MKKTEKNDAYDSDDDDKDPYVSVSTLLRREGRPYDSWFDESTAGGRRARRQLQSPDASQ
jgi:hypothetical protein